MSEIVNFDLFGVPVLERNRMRGRPQHTWTLESSNKIKLLLALGWSNDRIANALGISLPTLRKHYFSELKVRAVARDQMEAARAAKLFQLGIEENNVAALKEFGRYLERNDAMVADREIRGEDEPKVTRLGKKEIAAREAEEADASGWGGDLAFRGGSVN